MTTELVNSIAAMVILRSLKEEGADVTNVERIPTGYIITLTDQDNNRVVITIETGLEKA